MYQTIIRDSGGEGLIRVVSAVGIDGDLAGRIGDLLDTHNDFHILNRSFPLTSANCRR